MSDSGIPAPVAEFLDQHINSIVQVEVLLLLRRTGAGAMSSAAVGRELRIDAAWAETELAYLAAHGLLTARVENASAVYAYAPASDALRQAVEGLAKAYAERRVSVITRIFSKPSDKIRTFADAFRLRKDP